jgi:hypothetical protein
LSHSEVARVNSKSDAELFPLTAIPHWQWSRGRRDTGREDEGADGITRCAHARRPVIIESI